MVQNLPLWANQMIIIDESNMPVQNDPMLSFALEEWLCKRAAATNQSMCRIWRHSHAFILGQQDARLPNVKDALNWLQSKGYSPIVRNSGGAAVPLDEGVVNVSLIFPSDASSSSVFHQDFEKMYELIAAALAPSGAAVHKGEISGAYCPGDYDLSVAGRKFCGIAQRRLLRAYSVQAFIIASGHGAERTKLVRQFYKLASKENEALSYPRVTDDSTGSLEELTSIPPSGHESFVAAIKHTLLQSGAVEYPTQAYKLYQDIISLLISHLCKR